MTTPAISLATSDGEPAILIADEDDLDTAIDRAIQRATDTAVYTALTRADAPSELILPPPLSEHDPVGVAVYPAIEAAIDAAVDAAIISAIDAASQRHYDLHDVWRRAADVH